MPDLTQARDLTTLLYVALATSLGWIGGWLTRRKREPVELAKITAETRQISINTDVSLLQAASEAIEKAEKRREEWLQKEEQLRGQVIFWRNKAEEMDGYLIDSRDANAQLHARLKVKQDALDKSAALIHYQHISFSEADMPEIRELVDILREHHKRVSQEQI